MTLRLYALLLRALPVEIRESAGAWMWEDARRLVESARRERGRAGALLVGLRLLGDLAVAIPRERRAARGGYEWQRTRSLRGTLGWGERAMMWIRDLRVAFRALVRRPGFMAIATLTLGLGIGATVAIFSVVNGVVIQPLPFPDSDRIVEIRHHAPGIDLDDLNNSPGTIRFYRERARSFGSLAAAQSAGVNVMVDGQAERVSAAFIEPTLWEVFRIQPLLGRTFVADDVVADGPATVALLSSRMWRQDFGADPEIVGQSISLDGRTMEIIGVLPEGFAVPNVGDVDVVGPLWLDPEVGWGSFGTWLFGRLADGSTLESAGAEVAALQAQVPEVAEGITAEQLAGFGWRASVRTAKEAVVGDIGATLFIVLGTVGFVLLIACANVANLFLVRAESRQKEFAVRAALGAGRRRVAGGFLSEALVLGAMGGLLGMVIAWTGTGWLTSIDLPLPRLQEVALTPTVIGFAGGVSLLSALLLGLIPMVRYAGTGWGGLLRDGNRTSTDGRVRHRARNVLVMSQLALGLVLLVSSGLLFRSLQALGRIDLGFDPTNTLAVQMSAGTSLSLSERADFYHAVVERARALPGVESAGFGSSGPLLSGSFSGGSFQIEGVERADDAIPDVALYRAMGPGYMEALGMRLVAGRPMTDADWQGSVPVVWVNEHFRDAFLDGQAVGKRITWENNAELPVEQQYAEIAGVFEMTREGAVTEDDGGFALLPMLVGEWGYPDISSGAVFLRGAPGTDVTSLAPAVREIVASINPNVPITESRSMEQAVEASLADRAITMTLVSIATGLALFLGAIGLFGVISYVVGQRTREIGVRIALGAESREVSGMVVRQGLGVIAGGIVLGLVAAFGLTRTLASLLHEDVSTTDPLTFVAAPILLVVVSLIATWLPARRASRVDPLEALRSE